VEVIAELEQRHAKLLGRLPAELRAHYWSRHEEASAEPGSGRWVFPPPIFDEAEWRRCLAEQQPAASGPEVQTIDGSAPR
jgi:hypothetical protein